MKEMLWGLQAWAEGPVGKLLSSPGKRGWWRGPGWNWQRWIQVDTEHILEDVLTIFFLSTPPRL